MTDTVTRDPSARPAFVETTLRYIDPGEELPILNSNDHAGSKKTYDVRPIRIHDARRRGDLALDGSGFVLLREPTSVRDFTDAAEIEHRYVPEVESVVRRLTGADRVLIFGATLRSSTGGPRAETIKEPSVAAHVDYTAKTLRERVVLEAGEAEAAALLQRDFVNLNLWRPLKRVESKPLCLCDAASVERADLKIAGIVSRFRQEGEPPVPVTESYNLMFNPAHRWYYVPDMEPDELLVFKLCDTRTGLVTPHTAFDDPTSPPDAAPRESFEIRAIAFV